MIPSSRLPIQLLLIEDNPGDVRLTREAFRDARICNQLTVAGDGDEALRILRRQGQHAALPPTDLVLLDLNLPRMSGAEVLSTIKQDPALCHIPVIILTTSGAEEDILRSYRLQANAYVMKPVGLGNFLTAMRGIEQFWLELVRLP